VPSPRRVFLNAANVTASGPTVLVANLLPALYAAAPEVEFTTLIPDSPPLLDAARAVNSRILTRRPRRGLRNDLGRLWDLHRGLAQAVRASGAEVCLTLGDVGPRRVPCRHVVFLHNPLFVYSPDDLAGEDDWSPAKRRYLIWQFQRSLAGASGVVVQTPVMRRRLRQRYGVDESRARVIPQPVPRHVSSSTAIPGRSPLAACPKPVRLLFLAAHYPHKNHRVLAGVARELRSRGLDRSTQIFVTLGGQAPPELRALLDGEADVLTDVGRLAPAAVPEALADATALFLPTLVESYGLIYLEAMACRRPILTSDRDFARWMCGDAALYFDPLDARSIVDAIATLASSARDSDVSTRASARLGEFPRDWSAVAAGFLDTLRDAPA
jgi:glycosyltransferase involved in cell wall biosynthesis